MILIRGRANLVDQRYLAYAFQSPLVQGRMAARATGTTVLGIKQSELRQVDVPVPPLPVQRKIAAVLSAYDELIENNLRRFEILEEMAQAVYREWFVNFRFPGHENVALVDSPLGPIPEGWTVERLAHVAAVNSETIRNGRAPDEIRYIDISSVSPGSIDSVSLMSFENAPSRARRLVREGDTLWSTVRPNRRSDALVLEPSAGTVASTGFAVLRPTKLHWAYVHLSTTTNDFTAYLVNHARGAAYPAVNAEDFANAPILCPDESVVVRFGAMVEPMFRVREVLRRQNANLRTTRDLLLPRLVSGDLDVSELDIDTEWLAS